MPDVSTRAQTPPVRTPSVPAWFTGRGDPWLTRRMRDLVEITAADQQVHAAAAAAISGFLNEARTAILGETDTGGDVGAVTAAAEYRPTHMSAWRDEGAW